MSVTVLIGFLIGSVLSALFISRFYKMFRIVKSKRKQEQASQLAEEVNQLFKYIGFEIDADEYFESRVPNKKKLNELIAEGLGKHVNNLYTGARNLSQQMREMHCIEVGANYRFQQNVQKAQDAFNASPYNTEFTVFPFGDIAHSISTETVDGKCLSVNMQMFDEDIVKLKKHNSIFIELQKLCEMEEKDVAKEVA